MPYVSSKLLIPLLGYLVAFGPLSIDMYLPSLPTIAEDLDASQHTIQGTITVFLFGMAFGMLLFGPLSDFLGRKRLLLIGVAFYTLSSLLCAMAKSGEYLLLFRFLQSLGAASAAVLSRALVRDLFELERAGGILSNMHIISMLVMLISPILGAYIVAWLHWSWIFYFLTLASVLAFIGCCLLIQEPRKASSKTISLATYFQHYNSCLRYPNLMNYVFANAFSFAGMFCFITASAFVYIDFFGLTETQYALLFSSNIGAIIIVTSANSFFTKRLGLRTTLRIAALFSIVASGLMLVSSLFYAHQLLFFVLPCMIYISVTGAIGANSLATLFKLQPEKAGTSSGLFVALQFAIGGGASLFTSHFFDGSPQSLLYIMSACGVIAFTFHSASRRGA